MKTTCVAADTINKSTIILSEFEHSSVAEGQEDNIIRVCAGAFSVECSCNTSVRYLWVTRNKGALTFNREIICLSFRPLRITAR